ncbi:Hagh [Aphelenchoides besseyi]|nr:Hagh [Aphelenchoides besseyi]
MGKIARSNDSKKPVKKDTENTLLKLWKEEAAKSGRLPWAPKPHYNQNFNEQEVTYVAKTKVLTEMYNQIYNKNLKIRYRLNAIAKEIKSLKRVKRVLCRRLLDLNDEDAIGIHLEIPDKDTNTVDAMGLVIRLNRNQTIGDVVKTVQNNFSSPITKKKKFGSEKRINGSCCLPKDLSMFDAECSKEEKFRIMSIIDTSKTRTLVQQIRNMKILVDRVLADNYMYYIIDTNTRESFVVDMGSCANVANIERREEFKLTGALITHHHWDHSGGLAEFHKQYPNVKIFGQDKSRINELTDVVEDNQIIEWNDMRIQCISTPGHTQTHTCYYVQDQKTKQNALFTGDTIFLAGCGKFFECPASVMYETIYNRLFNIVADNTEMYFGHEYSLNNLKFAKTVEPQNMRTLEKFEAIKQQLAMGRSTCPSIWGEEKLYNPFLRVREDSVKNFAQAIDPIAVLDRIREKKNNYKS